MAKPKRKERAKRKPKNQQTEIVNQKLVFQAMTPAMQKVATKVDSLICESSRGNLLTAYDIGLEVKRVIDDEAKYGSNSVEELAAFIRRSPTTLYAFNNMTRIYTRAQVEAISAKKTDAGSYVTLSHVLSIIKVSKVADRKKLWTRVFKEDLSVENLEAEISAGYDRTNVRRGGRKASKPSSPLAAAQQVFENFQSIHRRLPIWKESLLDEVDQMPIDKIDTILLERLNKSRAQMVEVHAELDGFVDHLEKNIKRVETVIKKHEKAAEEAESAEAESKASKKQLAAAAA